MEIAAFIDWISVTHKGSAEIVLPEALPTAKKEDKARNGYTHAFKHSTGIIEMYNPDRPDMGLHFVYSGKVLQQINQLYGVTRDDILRTHTTTGGKVSRVDFAIDAKDSGISLLQLWEELEGKSAKTLSKHSRTQTGENGGDTVYIGSRKTRTKLLRVYDKAKEMGDFVSDYIRIELETRGDIARNAVRVYQDNGYSASFITSAIRGFCHFPCNDKWCSVCSTNPSKIPTGAHVTTDRERWLIKTVAPSLAQAMHDNPNFFSDFIQHVTFHYNELNASNP